MPSVMTYSDWDLAILNGLTPVGGLLNLSLVHLFSNNFTPSKVSVLADFVEATFNGYAAQPVLDSNWTAAYQNAAGDGERSSDVQVEFTASGIAVPETVWGYYVTDNPATVVRFAERFAAAVPMGTAVGQHIGLILRVVLTKIGFDGSAAQIL